MQTKSILWVVKSVSNYSVLNVYLQLGYVMMVSVYSSVYLLYIYYMIQVHHSFYVTLYIIYYFRYITAYTFDIERSNNATGRSHKVEDKRRQHVWLLQTNSCKH